MCSLVQKGCFGECMYQPSDKMYCILIQIKKYVSKTEYILYPQYLAVGRDNKRNICFLEKFTNTSSINDQ